MHNMKIVTFIVDDYQGRRLDVQQVTTTLLHQFLTSDQFRFTVCPSDHPCYTCMYNHLSKYLSWVEEYEADYS